MTFYDNGTAIGTGTLALVGGSDEATLTTSVLPGGADPIAAYTSGDANFVPSAASTRRQPGGQPDCAATALVSASPNPSVYGRR